MTTITFDELKPQLNDVTILDVRSKEQVEKHGQIPGGHNIPMTELESAINMDKQEFQAKYGFEKPSAETPIVTHCTKGGRAMKAALALGEKGFTNTKCYSGSFDDWVKNGGEVVKKGD